MQAPLFSAPETAASDPGTPVRPLCGGKRWIELPGPDQLSFVARCTNDLVPQDAFVRLLDEILEALDFSAFEAAYPGGGHPAFHPRFIAKIVIYGMCMRVLSARELSRRIERDTHFMWLAREQRVDHEVFSKFRRRFKTQLRGLFQKTVSLGVRLGLVSFGCIAIDGTKIAAAAKRRALNQADLEKAITKLDERIAQMLAEAEALDIAETSQFGTLRGDEVPRALSTAQARREKLLALLPLAAEHPKQRLSPTDPEAPVQKTQDGKRPGYNAQIAVDEQVGLIVAEVVTDEQNDTQQFAPMAKQVIENLGQIPATVVADTGYHSAEALEYLAGQPEVNAYIKQSPATPGQYAQDAFAYDADSDSYTCPAGRCLVFKNTTTLHDKTCRVYRSTKSCADCPQRAECFRGKSPYRKLTVLPHSRQALAMRQRLATDAGQQALQTRSATVERTFGTIKAHLGLRQFLARGLHNAQAQFTVAALAVNVLKLAGHVAVHGWAPAPAVTG